jgi:hypothetical protein
MLQDTRVLFMTNYAQRHPQESHLRESKKSRAQQDLLCRGRSYAVISSKVFRFVSIVTSLYSSNRPALCVCQAIGPVFPALGS